MSALPLSWDIQKFIWNWILIYLKREIYALYAVPLPLHIHTGSEEESEKHARIYTTDLYHAAAMYRMYNTHILAI